MNKLFTPRGSAEFLEAFREAAPLARYVQHDSHFTQSMRALWNAATERAVRCCETEARKYSKRGHEAAACRGAINYAAEAIKKGIA